MTETLDKASPVLAVPMPPGGIRIRLGASIRPPTEAVELANFRALCDLIMPFEPLATPRGIDIDEPTHKKAKQAFKESHLPAWGPYVRDEGDNGTSASGVQAITLLVLDFDGVPAEHVQECLSPLDEYGLAHAITPSFSYKGPEFPNIRVCVPFDKPCPVSRWAGVFKMLHAFFGGKADPQCSNVNRGFYYGYVNERYALAARDCVVFKEGKALDWDAVETFQGLRMRLSGIGKGSAESRAQAVEQAHKALETACKRIRSAAKGTGNDTVNRQTFALARKWAHVLTRDEVLLAVTEAKGARDYRLHQHIPTGAMDAADAATFDSGWGAGLLINQEKFSGWRETLHRSIEGTVVNCLANIQRICDSHERLRGCLQTNERNEKVQVSAPLPWDTEWVGPRDLRDEDGVRCAVFLSDEDLIHTAQDKGCYTALQAAAGACRFDPFRDYLEGLEWDGTPRVADWLLQHAGADGDPRYVRAVTQAWLVGAVKRTMEPGCKHDYVLILQGAQGMEKSKFWTALAGKEFYSPGVKGRLTSADAAMSCHGPVVVEMAELDNIRGKAANEVKAFLTTDVDYYRPPYGRAVLSKGRRCVFAGTTNEREFLHDPTGGRRFWPVPVQRLDAARMEQDRDQLWAEAFSLYQAGAKNYLDPEIEALAEDAQEDVREQDPWEDSLRTLLLRSDLKAGGQASIGGDTVVWDASQIEGGCLVYITNDQALTYLGVPVDRRDMRHARQLGAAMRGLGMVRRKLGRAIDPTRTARAWFVE